MQIMCDPKNIDSIKLAVLGATNAIVHGDIGYVPKESLHLEDNALPQVSCCSTKTLIGFITSQIKKSYNLEAPLA
jgi:hypothetical protein